MELAQLMPCPNTWIVLDVYQGNSDAVFRGGDGVGQLDPVVMVSAMASVTESVAFGITGSTSYISVLSTCNYLI